MKRAGLTFSTALILSAIVMGGAAAAPQQFGRMSRGGQLGAQSSGSQSYGRTYVNESAFNTSTTQSSNQQGNCTAGNQMGSLTTQGQSGGWMNSQMGSMGTQSSTNSGSTQLTVAPVRSSPELTQLLKVVRASASGTSFQIKPNGDGQSATVSINGSAGASSSTLAQTLESSGFQILEVSVQGSGRSSNAGNQQQQRVTGSSYQGATANRAQYGQAASVAAQYAAALLARSMPQYRAASQGRYR